MLGVGTAYAIDAVSCLAMVWAVVVMAPQPPQTDVAEHPPVLRSIAEGLRYVRGNQALVGSFAIDLVAMTFGMPRALFAVLAVSVYHAGRGGHRAALRGRVGGRDDRGADHRLDRARAAPGRSS